MSQKQAELSPQPDMEPELRPSSQNPRFVAADGASAKPSFSKINFLEFKSSKSAFFHRKTFFLTDFYFKISFFKKKKRRRQFKFRSAILRRQNNFSDVFGWVQGDFKRTRAGQFQISKRRNVFGFLTAMKFQKVLFDGWKTFFLNICSIFFFQPIWGFKRRKCGRAREGRPIRALLLWTVFFWTKKLKKLSTKIQNDRFTAEKHFFCSNDKFSF